MSALRRARARSPLSRLVLASRGLLLALASLASLTLAPSAHAEGALLLEPATELHLTVEVPGATACVVVPKASQRADDCDDLNLPALEAMANGEKDAPTGIALVRFPGWSFSLMVSSQLGVSPRSAEQIEEYARGVAEGAASQFGSVKVHGKAPGSAYDLETINGIHAIRFQVDLSAPKDPKADPVRLDYAALVGRSGLALVAVVVDQKHAAEAEPLVRGLLATASMPHPTIAGFGQPGATTFGRLGGLGIGGLVVLLLVPVLALRSARRKKPARPR
ncbi:MAG: hypothetical protein ABI193_12125 [Minicystis sp.]